MQFCFIRDGAQTTMPVTPASYHVDHGRRIETINISALGDVYRPGGRTRFQGSFEFLLPAQRYPWALDTQVTPQTYLDRFRGWMEDKRPVRMIITQTEVSLPVYIETVTEEERDGTGDKYMTVAVREYVELAAPVKSAPGASAARPAAEQSTDVQSYSIKSGDTLGALCRRYYGNSSAKYYKALASYNGIKNPNVIRVGQTLKIPPQAVLFGGVSV